MREVPKIKRVLAMITPVSRQRIEGISRFARESGWMLTIHDRLGGMAPSGDYDGLLVTLRADERGLKYVRYMLARGVPAVDLTIQKPKIRIPRVISDHRQIGFMAGEYFKERGFRRIAWFSTGWTNVHAIRFAGLAEAVGNAPAKWVMHRDADTIRTLRAVPKPVAVLVYDEAEAVHLLQLCLAAGLDVPDEVAILSIGDDPLITDNQPVPISCIRQNFFRGGYEAASLLDRLMAGRRPPSKPILIPPDGITVRRSTDTVAEDDPLIRKALLYIRDNLNQPFGAEQVANGLAVSRSRLDKTCTAHFGHSLGKEILNARLNEAKRLLRDGSLNIDEIARRTGFCATTYFITKFRREFGDTPRRWRTKCIQNTLQQQRREQMKTNTLGRLKCCASFCMLGVLALTAHAADVSITGCGAKTDGSKCTSAIAEAIERCTASGGGRVIVPPGTWLTGRVQLASGVELHLSEGATLEFSDDPADYLPPVMTSWEGIECINLSPLVSAFGATNVAIGGKGVLKARTAGWERWRVKGPKQAAAQMKLIEWGANDTPVSERDLTRLDEANKRPPFIGFNRCRGVRLQDFTLRGSPFWCIHMFHCRDVILRRLDVAAHGSNTDGANFESTKGVLVEDCAFDQGDDVICCKSGRDRDGRRRGVPTEDVLVRRCTAKAGHGLFTIGSELSGGVRNVKMEDCTAPGELATLFNLKTRPTRGGFVENVTFRRIRANAVSEAVVNITTRNKRWAHLEKGLERIPTRIDGITVEDVQAKRAKRIINVHGDADLPISRLNIRSVSAETASSPDVIENADLKPRPIRRHR